MKLNLKVEEENATIPIDALDSAKHYIGVLSKRTGGKYFISGDEIPMCDSRGGTMFRARGGPEFTAGDGLVGVDSKTLSGCVRAVVAKGLQVHVWTTREELFAWLAAGPECKNQTKGETDVPA